MSDKTLLGRMAVMIQELADLRSENKLLTAMVKINKDEFSKELTLTRESLNNISKEKALLEITIQQIRAENFELHNGLDKKTAEHMILGAEIEKATMKISELQQNSQLAKNELTVIQNKLTAAQNEVTTAQTELTATQNKLTAAHNKLLEIIDVQNKSEIALVTMKEDHLNKMIKMDEEKNKIWEEKLALEFQLEAINKMLVKAETSDGNQMKRARTE